MTSTQSTIRQRFLALSSIEDLAGLLEVTEGQLRWHSVRSNPEKRYREFEIPKSSGGDRKILAPSPGLKLLQKKINNVLQAVYQPRGATYGFVRERDVKKNATRHVGNRWVLNIDLENFFPTINFGRVRGMFISKPYELPETVATILAQICCHKNQLPQGAPTSPVLSNMICRRLDNELTSIAKKYSCVYSRYADDITFSSNRPLFPLAIGAAELKEVGGATVPGDELLAIIKKNGFNVNNVKTRLQRSSSQQTVTGLVVNRKVNVKRSYVRGIRGMLHAWEKYGLKAAQETFETKYYRQGSRAPFMQAPHLNNFIRGKISYLGFIRGRSDNLYIRYRDWFNTLDPST